jgi:hypothetical protein
VSGRCEVDGAGGVECFLRAGDGQPGEQESVFVAVAGGFNWKFTADDLTALLRRTSQHEQTISSQQATLPQAA